MSVRQSLNGKSQGINRSVNPNCCVLRSVIFMILVSSISFIAQGQNTLQTSDDSKNLIIYDSQKLTNDLVDGSSNFNDNWKKGTLTTLSGEILEHDSMIYNIYLKKVLFLQDGILHSLSKQGLFVREVSIGEDKFLYSAYAKSTNLANNEMPIDYFQVLVEGESISLLKHYKCTILEGRESQGITPGTRDKYIVRSDYYVLENDQMPSKLRSKKDHVLELMKNDDLDMKSFLKKNKTNLKKEADLIKLFEFYNSNSILQ